MNYPKISIVTPNYNQGEFIERTILSVLNQGYPNLEYIIMDGGSTDNSIEIIKKYEKQLTYWVSEKDGGMYDALNKGFKKSTGEIMGWINSDDFLHHKSLFIIAKIFSDLPKIQWVQGLPNVANNEDNIVYIRQYRQYSQLDFLSDYKSQQWIQQESTYWTKSLYQKAGNKIEIKYKLAGDFDLWMRFFQFEKIYAFNGLVGTYRITNKNASMVNNDKYLNEASEIVDSIKINLITKIKVLFAKRIRIIKKIGNYEYLPFMNKFFAYPKRLRYNFKSNKFELI
jgi:glycosyltransferase involved in cell wall biosynthesis